MIAIAKLKTILFVAFKSTSTLSLFFSFESDKNFFSVHFLKCLLRAEIYFWFFGAYCSVFGLWRLIFVFLIHVKFPIDGYILRSYWFWSPNSIFGLWRLIFAFLTPKRIFFPTLCKIPDRWIYHMTILILGPNSVFGLWRLIFTFLTPKSILFLGTCKVPDQWIYHTIILIVEPKFRFCAVKASF
jgi:hypothetical protein